MPESTFLQGRPSNLFGSRLAGMDRGHSNSYDPLAQARQISNDPVFEALRKRALQTARGTAGATAQSLQDLYARRGASVPLSALIQASRAGMDQQADLLNSLGAQRLSFLRDALGHQYRLKEMEREADLNKGSFLDALPGLAVGAGSLLGGPAGPAIGALLSSGAQRRRNAAGWGGMSPDQRGAAVQGLIRMGGMF